MACVDWSLVDPCPLAVSQPLNGGFVDGWTAVDCVSRAGRPVYDVSMIFCSFDPRMRDGSGYWNVERIECPRGSRQQSIID